MPREFAWVQVQMELVAIQGYILTGKDNSMGKAEERPVWQEQFDRVHRYWRRLHDLCGGTEFYRPAQDYLDDIHAFCVECHSLKDWLVNDPTFEKPNKKRSIERYINENRCLAIIADLANGKKHLVCDADKIRSGAVPTFKYWFTVSTRHEESTLDLSIENGHKLNAERADKIKANWLATEEFQASDIVIRILVDVQHDGRWLDLDQGIADLASEAIDAWEKFIHCSTSRP